MRKQRRSATGLGRVGAVVAVGVALMVARVPAGAAAGTRPTRSVSDIAHLKWTRSPADPPGAGNLDSLATDGKVFVVTGLAGVPTSGFVPIWTSTDGVRWTQAKGPKSAFPASVVVGLVVYAHGHFTAFGEPMASREVLAWTSADGKRWKAYKARHFPLAPDNEPSGVVATKTGLLLQTLENGQTYHLWNQSNGVWRGAGRRAR